jgi:hypothetical protein
MSRAVEIIMNITGCSEDDAQRVYAETNNVEDAVDKLFCMPESKSRKYIEKIKPVKVVNEYQETSRLLREQMKKLDEVHSKRSISSNQPDCVAQVEQSTPREETVPQSNCYQECQLPVLEVEAQKLEIVCPSPSGYSCGLRLSDQI